MTCLCGKFRKRKCIDLVRGVHIMQSVNYVIYSIKNLEWTTMVGNLEIGDTTYNSD
uniref:Uncharacterized protein n=1 Tax=Rhizophora mucronata TaxID=61149 RepID=A0A2P2JPI8_RHIMU